MHRRIRRPKDEPSVPRFGRATLRRRHAGTSVGRNGRTTVLWFRDPPAGGTLRLGLCHRAVVVREVESFPVTAGSPVVTWLFARGGMSLVLLGALILAGLVGGAVSGR